MAAKVTASLESLGYTVAGQAEDGETALQRVEEAQPDLVLMEIRLKGQVDGIEAAKQIRANYDIPVIFISAHADTLTLKTAMTAQAYGLMIKPFAESDLKTNISMALYKHMTWSANCARARNATRWRCAPPTTASGIGT
jgi:CheY-like chemotaxis protein